MGVYITCLIIAYTGVALRFVSRRMKRTQLKTDDWLIVVSLVSSESFGESYFVLEADSDFGQVLHNGIHGHQYKPDARWPWTASDFH